MNYRRRRYAEVSELANEKKAAAGRRFIEKPIRSALPIWTAAAVWVPCCLLLPFYRIGWIIFTAALSLAAGLIVHKVIPKETEKIEVPFSSGNPDLDQTVAALNEAMDAIIADSDAVRGRQYEAAEKMLGIARAIEWIREDIIKDPNDIKLIRRFLNYYLPTTVKLTNKYVFTLSQKSDGENISETLSSIENVLGQIKTSFDKQHDALFADDALDISTDAVVLETMMKKDNLL